MKNKKLSLNTNRFNLSITNIFKIINGKKYHYQGEVPKNMEYDIKRIYEKHGIVIEAEPIELGKIKLWGRNK